MRKVVIHAAGGYQQLRIEAHPDPRPGPGEVAIAAEACGVNYADCVVRMGLYASAKKYVGWPITPGFEVAGTIAEVGAGVDGWRIGDRVLAVTRFGGYASRLVVPAHQVFALPARFSMADGAGFPGVFLTAYYALMELARPRPGQRLLIHSAAGGVGGALVQLGKLARCTTVGVVGASHKVAAARALGADEVIDKSAVPLWPTARALAPRGYDVILDANGVATLEDSYRHLASPGRLVIYGFHSMLPRQGGRPNWAKLAVDWLRTPRFSPLAMTGANHSVMGFNLSYLFDAHDVLAEGMAQLLGWVAAGQLVAPPVRTFALDDVAAAHRALESGQTVGKLVLIP
jgi:NADPH:quinone reductase-like Zn-dependent oxidoreductase